jgi:hypothetical protein
VDLYPDLPADAPWGGAGDVGPALLVDYRPQWPWAVSAVFINLNNAGCFLFFIVAGLSGRGELVKPVWIYMFAVAVLHDSASAAYFAAAGRLRDAAASALVVRRGGWAEERENVSEVEGREGGTLREGELSESSTRCIFCIGSLINKLHISI